MRHSPRSELCQGGLDVLRFDAVKVRQMVLEPSCVEQVPAGTFGAGQVKKRLCLKCGHQTRMDTPTACPGPVRIEISHQMLPAPEVQQGVGGAAVKAD